MQPDQDKNITLTKKLLKAETITHKCGCQLKKVGDSWQISNYCYAHMPNYRKRSYKVVKLRYKKRGRGYTKSNKK